MSQRSQVMWCEAKRERGMPARVCVQASPLALTREPLPGTTLQLSLVEASGGKGNASGCKRKPRWLENQDAKQKCRRRRARMKSLHKALDAMICEESQEGRGQELTGAERLTVSDSCGEVDSEWVRGDTASGSDQSESSSDDSVEATIRDVAREKKSLKELKTQGALSLPEGSRSARRARVAERRHKREEEKCRRLEIEADDSTDHSSRFEGDSSEEPGSILEFVVSHASDGAPSYDDSDHEEALWELCPSVHKSSIEASSQSLPDIGGTPW